MHYSLTRATIWNIAGYIYLLIAALISTPILVHHLGLIQFGQYSLIIATLALVSSIDLGLSQSVVRALSRDHEFSLRRQTLWATSSPLFIATGIVNGAIATFVAYNFHISYTVIPIIFCLGLMGNIVAHYSTLPQAEGHFGYFNAKTFIVGTANTFVAAYLASHGQGLLAIIISLLVSYLISLLFLAYFSLKFFPHPMEGKPSLSVARSLISFGLRNQVGKLVGQAQSQYGKYLLAALSPLGLSAFVIAQGLVQKLVGGVGAVATAFYPGSARFGITPSTKRIYTRVQVCLFLLGLFAIILYGYIGQPFLMWWLKDISLVNSVHSFIMVYRYYGLLLLLTPMASTVLDSLGYPGTTSLFGTLAFIIEIIVALTLYPHFGLLAPAYAGIVSLGIMTPVLLVFTGRILSRGGTVAH